MKPEAARDQLEEDFNRKRVGHRIVQAVTEEVYRSVVTADRERIITLVGPTGVGKSTVIEKVRHMLVRQYHDEMVADPGFLPFIYLTTKPGLDADFNWKDLFARLLNEANEPLIGKKRRFPYRLDGQELASIRGLTGTDLGRAFAALVENRRVRVIFFDEASSMIDAKVNKNILRQFNTLKALAVSLDVVIVLIGAYDMVGINQGNGQLVRRAQVIHMPRYRHGGFTLTTESDKEPDEIAFADAVTNLASVAPVQIETDVLLDMRFIFHMSVGCLGIFRHWLREACVAALCKNGGVLTRPIFEAEAPKRKSVLKYTREAELGEQEMEDISEDVLAKALGLEFIRSARAAPKTESETKATAAAPKRNSGRVGTRGPSRDPVGALHA